MSIEDFDNDAPDNRPTERWTRIADAARHDERRKIWKACSMDGEPPSDTATMAGQIRISATVPLDVSRQSRAWLSDIYYALTGAWPTDDVTSEELFDRCRDLARVLADIEPERHEEIEVTEILGIVLRSVDLARAVAALQGTSPVERTRYLRLDDVYFVQADPPVYSLTEEREHELATEADAALDARDGAGYLEVLRQVVGGSGLEVLAIDPVARVKPVCLPGGGTTAGDCGPDDRLDPCDGRLAAVRELRPVLAELRAALGLRDASEPVHVHEMISALNAITFDVKYVRAAVSWLVSQDAREIRDLCDRLFAQQAEHGGRGLDLVAATSCWYTYWRERVSDALDGEIKALARKLWGES